MMFDKDPLPEETDKRSNARTHSADDLRKNPALKQFKIDQLIRLNNLLAETDDGLLGQRPRKNRIARRVVTKWRQIFNDKHARSLIEPFVVESKDQDELIEHLKRARACHGQKWFSFEWLLSFKMVNFKEDLWNEPNVARMFDGEYRELEDWMKSQREQKPTKGRTLEDIGEDFFQGFEK